MAKIEKKVRVISFIKDWGFVEGKWVYIPLWDPAPYLKTSLVFKQFKMVSDLRELSRVMVDKKLAARVTTKAQAMGKGISSGLINGWEDGDDICPPFPIPFPWPIRDSILDKVQIAMGADGLPVSVTNKLIGSAIEQVGKALKDKELISLGAEIANVQGAVIKS